MSFPRTPFLLLLALALLSACASQPPQPEPTDREQRHAERMERLLAWPGWSLTGRLGVNRGDEGGSGRLDWTYRADRSRLDFRGTLGQGAWRLDVTPEFARLELKDGTVREAPRVEDLVFDQTGWEAPVTALSWWVRGLACPADRFRRIESSTKTVRSQPWNRRAGGLTGRATWRAWKASYCPAGCS